MKLFLHLKRLPDQKFSFDPSLRLSMLSFATCLRSASSASWIRTSSDLATWQQDSYCTIFITGSFELLCSCSMQWLHTGGDSVARGQRWCESGRASRCRNPIQAPRQALRRCLVNRILQDMSKTSRGVHDQRWCESGRASRCRNPIQAPRQALRRCFVNRILQDPPYSPVLLCVLFCGF